MKIYDKYKIFKMLIKFNITYFKIIGKISGEIFGNLI